MTNTFRYISTNGFWNVMQNDIKFATFPSSITWEAKVSVDSSVGGNILTS